MLKKVLVVVAVSSLAVGASLAGYAYSTVRSHDFALRGTSQIRTMVMTQNDPSTISNTTLSTFTADTITVPANGRFRAVVRFSAESACSASSWCSADIFVDGVEANPKSGTDFAFDSAGGETWQSLSMDRTSDVIVGSGVSRAVTIDLRVAVIGGGSWRLDDWSVVTELVKGAS